jgi:integrase
VTGIDVRHRATCERRREDGKCCGASFQAHVFDKHANGGKGKRIRKTFSTRTAAKLWRQDALAALHAGELTADRGSTVREAAEQWLEDARSGHARNRSGDPYKPSAIRGYEQNLRRRVLPALGSMRLSEVRPRDLQELVDKLDRDGASPSTIDTTITPLRAIYRRARNRGLVTQNPTQGLDKPAVRSKPRRFASAAEAEALLGVIDGPQRALWATAFYAGLRRGELIALRWEDVDLATGLLRVRRGWDAVEGEIAPKSRQGRRNVPIPGALRDYLSEHAQASEQDGRVFGSDRQVRRWAEDAGGKWLEAKLPRLTLHDARHSYASLMIAAGVNAKALSTFMGHANIAITMDLYGHLMPGSEAQAADLLDAYLALEATVAETVARPPKPWSRADERACTTSRRLVPTPPVFLL